MDTLEAQECGQVSEVSDGDGSPGIEVEGGRGDREGVSR